MHCDRQKFWQISAATPEILAIGRQLLGNQLAIMLIKTTATAPLGLGGLGGGFWTSCCPIFTLFSRCDWPDWQDRQNKARIKALRRNALSRSVFVAYIWGPIRQVIKRVYNERGGQGGFSGTPKPTNQASQTHQNVTSEFLTGQLIYINCAWYIEWERGRYTE